MKVVTNVRGQETLAKEMNEMVSWCDEAYIVTAFFTDDSWVGRLAAESKTVKLVVSLRPPTNPDALRRILSYKNVQVKYLGKELHSKVYTFSKGDEFSWNESDFKCQAIVGSSNMTQGGFNNNIETNVILSQSLAKDALEQSRHIFDTANQLSPDVLDRYTEEYHRHPEVTFPEIHESIEKLNEDYKRIVYAVKHVVHLCSDLISAYFPDVPEYLVVDHFWDYLVVGRRSEREEIKQRAKQGESGERLIKELFKEYIIEESGKDHRYPDEMLKRSQQLSKLLAKRSLNEDDMEKIFLTFHASRYVEERYTNKVKSFIEKNSPEQVLRSLKHLANQEIDISVRLHDLQKKPLKLHALGESAIREFNGWMYPNKYPIWNMKSERALEMLGFS